jgi:hypothetical protein
LFKTNIQTFGISVKCSKIITLKNILENLLFHLGCHTLEKIFLEVEIGTNNLFHWTVYYGNNNDFICLIQFSRENFGETNTGQILQHIGDDQNNILTLAIERKMIDYKVNILFMKVSKEIVFNLLFYQKKKNHQVTIKQLKSSIK